ncbi:nitroreductase family protein [Mycobacterium intracellulare]|uniref:Nitroreductase family protein n=1 Tax=Mycobacterium intracellulare subsp. chimaera TaxID=222805 RepID=A0A220YH24_MYCIT|nr:nitroreductase family protein [Mycobacterium intracellulare]AOS93380.1 nitroreductase [Mycobacterium intracellulare subsp. chimaera]ARV83784.1 nitroreductase [Mycobacterium intracellulare subsp. chimaera]ASL11039.1 putative oxidoreductase [Mycobacterium intracellulare subsp. chimaera]ASL16934.1 putative oxidoreductase [Mycobacterium intracellulare subsp. chimaera]ASL22981.1 putative oxidoreductase [Mycobacterium intracellulare subsp. chimaera]
MDIYEALYTTRTMRRMRPDPIPLGTQARILDAAIRAPNGGNTQRWHFLVVDDHELKRKLAELYRRARDLEHEEFKNGTMALPAPGADRTAYAETLRRIIRSGNYLADHFEEVPLLLFVFAIDDHGGANVFPAIWSALLAARAEGVGGVMTTLLRYFTETVNELLGVPIEQGWTMSAMVAFGYPLGRWGVADRHPVHEVSSRNRWGTHFGAEVPEPLWPGVHGTVIDLRRQRSRDARC